MKRKWYIEYCAEYDEYLVCDNEDNIVNVFRDLECAEEWCELIMEEDYTVI